MAQCFRPVAVFFQDVVAQLYAAESDLGNILDRLLVLFIPGDSSVAKANICGRGCQRTIKVRKIHRRIKRRVQFAGQGVNRKSRGRGDCSETGYEMTTRY